MPGVLLRDAGMLLNAAATAPSGDSRPNNSAIEGGTWGQLDTCKHMASAFFNVSSKSMVPDMSFIC